MANAGGAPREVVVLVHGLLRTSRSLAHLGRHLEREGFAVANYAYRSTRSTIAEQAEELARRLPELVPAQAPQVHFVTHSLGGIVVRQLLKNQRLDRLGRVVMLAPPNQGSELADALAGKKFFRWVLGPTLAELQTGDAGVPNDLGPVDFPCGVIAGDFNFLGGLVFDGPNDGRVSVESAKVDGMADFLVVRHGHAFLMNSRDVKRQVTHFLRTGCFDRAGGDSPE
jgi:pimeloyl-ACP methyl ester carboxylesterase